MFDERLVNSAGHLLKTIGTTSKNDKDTGTRDLPNNYSFRRPGGVVSTQMLRRRKLIPTIRQLQVARMCCQLSQPIRQVSLMTCNRPSLSAAVVFFCQFLCKAKALYRADFPLSQDGASDFSPADGGNFSRQRNHVKIQWSTAHWHRCNFDRVKVRRTLPQAIDEYRLAADNAYTKLEIVSTRRDVYS